ncbi:MarR family winged helix-turn-helix transcriptional regulator [Antarcticirhabdus aurantiaca]|uniref:MarR family winged helix-turn-helix transcriptional regulator n=1 Tax=Antarcticirhabdus aurantiaca TaxID=2606717 RepID=A0ACD4NRA4_9HYPH|nr:MarR family winged helix-turn-helix transcriptional regulator [Antarcticirhabdus aurantiaca]WAJ29485.1 MarR family winged helix-turn-helix transcriptional regulator [Jeongeuplla avenae]
MSDLVQPFSVAESDEAPALLPALIAVSRSCRQLMQIKLSALGVMAGQDQLLDALGPGAPVPVGQLAARLNIRPSTASKMVDKLADHGLLVRVRDAGDARRTCVALTPSGKEALARVRNIWAELEGDLSDALAREGSLAATGQSIDRLADVLAARLAPLR